MIINKKKEKRDGKSKAYKEGRRKKTTAKSKYKQN